MTVSQTMDPISLDTLQSLAQSSEQPAVSILMPAVKAGPATRENPIRFKNLLRQAEDELRQRLARAADAEGFLAPAWQLEGDNDFWQHQDDGLAVYVDAAGARAFRVPLELPEVAVVTDRFYTKPLLALFSENARYYLLSLSQNQVRFYRGDRFGLREISLPDMPESKQEALWADQPSDQLQFHTVNTGVSGRGEATYHSSGDEAQDRHKDDIKRFFDKVDNAVGKYLAGRRDPLVLASVEYLQPIYATANSYGSLLERGVTGSPEDISEQDLGERAWTVAADYFAQSRLRDNERFGNSISSGRALSDLQPVLSAAEEGRVDTLWVAEDRELWGRYTNLGTVSDLHDSRQEGDEDLLDRAALQTLAAGGRIYVVPSSEIPSETAVAAILRY